VSLGQIVQIIGLGFVKDEMRVALTAVIVDRGL
jgi:hypothetical protein